MSNSYIIQKPIKMTPLLAIQCAVRHAVLKFAYSYTEMQCIIATHYFVKVSKFYALCFIRYHDIYLRQVFESCAIVS